MGGGLGLLILGCSFVWSGMTTQVGSADAAPCACSPPAASPRPVPRLPRRARSARRSTLRRAPHAPSPPRIPPLPSAPPRQVGLTVAISLPIVSLWANFLGGVFPLMSAHYGYNPAVTSAPLMTTVVDSTVRRRRSLAWAARSRAGQLAVSPLAGSVAEQGWAAGLRMLCAPVDVSHAFFPPRLPLALQGLIIYFLIARVVMGI